MEERKHERKGNGKVPLIWLVAGLRRLNFFVSSRSDVECGFVRWMKPAPLQIHHHWHHAAIPMSPLPHCHATMPQCTLQYLLILKSQPDSNAFNLLDFLQFRSNYSTSNVSSLSSFPASFQFSILVSRSPISSYSMIGKWFLWMKWLNSAMRVPPKAVLADRKEGFDHHEWVVT